MSDNGIYEALFTLSNLNFLKQILISGFLLLLMIRPVELVSQTRGVAGNPFIDFTWSNDFVYQTDRYFSNGIDLVLYHPNFKKLPGHQMMLPHKSNNEVWQGITFSHHFFTPRNLFETGIIYSDRPYASYFLVGYRKISLNIKQRLKTKSELQIGLLGRYSGGRLLQNGIHEALPTSRPATGWNNQLHSDFAVNYSVRVEKGLIHSPNFDMAPHVDVRAGIPYTDVAGGIFIRFGKFNDYFSTIGINKTRKLEFYVFTDATTKIVLYNATLQGGLIYHDIHTIDNIERFVTHLKTGFALGLKDFTIEYTQHFISPEFKWGLKHKWGSLALKVAI